MGSATTVISVMLLLSLVMTSSYVSAARQLNEIPKVGEQDTNSENTRVEIPSEANDKTLDDKKFFLPLPEQLPPFPFTQTLPGFPPMSLPALPNFFTPPSGN